MASRFATVTTHTPARVPRRESLLVGSVAALLCIAVGVALAGEDQRGLAVVGIAVGLALLLIVAELGVQSLVAWTVVSVAAYAFVRIPSGSAVVTFDRVWIGAMLGIFILAAAPARMPSRASRWMLLALAWLAAAYLLRAIETPYDRLVNIATAVDAVVLPLILFAVTRREAYTQRRVEQIAFGLALAGGLLAAIGIGERVLGFSLAENVGGLARFDENVALVRISGPYPAPEPYALALLVCMAATAYWLQARRAYAFGFALLALEGVAIGLTLFRAAWIGALIVVIASFGLRPKRFGRLLTALGIVGAVFVLGYGQLEESKTVRTRVENTSNVVVRLATYKESLQLFAEHPVFGVGVNQYPNEVKGRSSVTIEGERAEPFPHSSYFGQLAEQGLWGFAPLLACTFAVIVLLRHFRVRARGADQVLYASALGASLGYLLMSITLTMLPYGPSNAFFAVLLGLLAARLEALERERERDDPVQVATA